jgi:hypothetical protein
MAKRFFYVCAGLLCLAVTYHVGARRAGAQNVVTYQETAVLSGEVADGGTIPLPHFKDGSEALETECTWIVSPKTLAGNPDVPSGFPMFERCSTTGRTVRIYWCRSGCAIGGDCDPPQAGCSPTKMSGNANYLIVAVRSDTPTPVQKASWGRVKASYR